VEHAKKGRLDIWSSTVNYVECVWLKGVEKKLTEVHESVIQRFFEHSFLYWVNADRTIAESARRLCWKHQHLRPKDAIHIASALFADVHEIHSYDGDFLKLNGVYPNWPKIVQPPEPFLIP
jgi:predicted nucleic acid-binding protein